jgi:hypothetical protein
MSLPWTIQVCSHGNQQSRKHPPASAHQDHLLLLQGQLDSAPFHPATTGPEPLSFQDLNIQPGNTAALAAFLSSLITPLGPDDTTRSNAETHSPRAQDLYPPAYHDPETTSFQPHALLSLEQHVEGELVAVSWWVPGDEAGLLICCGGVVGRCWGGGGLVVREGKVYLLPSHTRVGEWL